MEHTIMFDTLQYTKELEAAGVKPREAEAHATALVRILEKQEDHVATKRDLDIAIADLRTEMNLKFAQVDIKFAHLESKFDNKFAEFRVEIIKWVVGISVAQAAFIISILKFFH